MTGPQGSDAVMNHPAVGEVSEYSLCALTSPVAEGHFPVCGSTWDREYIPSPHGTQSPVVSQTFLSLEFIVRTAALPRMTHTSFNRKPQENKNVFMADSLSSIFMLGMILMLQCRLMIITKYI